MNQYNGIQEGKIVNCIVSSDFAWMFVFICKEEVNYYQKLCILLQFHVNFF